MKRVVEQIGKPFAGLVLCGGSALLVAVFSAPRPWRVFVPFIFALVIILLASRYGMFVSLAGSATAALVFAYYLFQPVGSFAVASHAEKSNLAWMILSSVALSYLLLPSHVRHKSGR